MAQQAPQILFPPGRMVEGSMYEPNTKDMQGQTLVVKSGPDQGKPRQDWFFAVAIPKEPGHTHWAQTAWGQQIWAVGHAGFPGGQAQSPQFAWKITDGDSTVPNAKGTKPCDKEGYPGCWVVRFGSGFAPKLYNRDGTQQLTQPGAVNRGDYIQVLASVDANGQVAKPGVYINHVLVALAGYGQRIVGGPDAAAVGFGQGALPAGASAVPLGGMPQPAAPGAVAPTGMPPAIPGAVPSSTALPPLPGQQVMPPQMPPAVPQVVAPNTQYMQMPGATPAVPSPALPGAPSMSAAYSPASVPGYGAPPTPPGVPAASTAPMRRMLPPANGATYEAMIAAGWTDATLVRHGMMAP